MKSTHLLLVLFIFVLISCKKDNGSSEEEFIPPMEVDLNEASIQLPAGVNYSLKDHQLMTGVTIHSVSDNGKTKRF